MSTFTLLPESFSRLHVSDDKPTLRRYYCVVPTSEIPEEWTNWLNVNARDFTSKGRVPKAIRSTLTDNPEWFSEYNRGLTIVASWARLDNKTKKLSIEFDNPDRHGVLDGGHTLGAILDDRDQSGQVKQSSYCNIEIFTGLEEREISNVVEARNSSKQVASQSLANLDGKFDDLKMALGEKKTELISWRENEGGDFDVREVIGILTALDRESYDNGIHPITAYSGKEACIRRFASNDYKQAYQKLNGIVGDALEIWDAIQYYLPNQYNKMGSGEGTTGRFGGLKGVKQHPKKKKLLPFIGRETEYDIPSGYIYPILSSFRAMLVEEKALWTWGKGINAIQLIEEGAAAEIFVNSVRDSIGKNNPNQTGKDSQVWNSAFMKAENIYLKRPD